MFELISIIGLLTFLALIAAGIGQLITEQRRTRRMLHDHVHGITNYLAESTQELRMLRSTMQSVVQGHDDPVVKELEKEIQGGHCSKPDHHDHHGHHHN